MNNCYLGHKEAIKNLESDILKSGYKPVPLKNNYNLDAFTKHNELVSVEAAKVRKVVEVWDSALSRLGIKGSVVKSIVKDNLADGDSLVPFARRVIDIVYNEDVLKELDDFRKSLGIYDSKLSYASYLETKRAEQSLNEQSLSTPVSSGVQDATFQKQTQSQEGIIASEKTIRDLAARMADRIGIPVRFESDRTKNYKGKLENNTAVINLAYATLDTPIHEVAGHSIIRALKIKSEKNINVYLEDMITKGIITKEC